MITTDPFEKLARDCTPMVYRFLLSLCGNEDLAEELTSETFYQAYLHIGSFRGACKPETWLCQIAKNAFYREMRRTKRIVPWEDPGAAGDPLEGLARRDQALRIHRLLHQLRDPYKEVFLLRVFGELRFQEIADIYEKTESWAKTTFYRAKGQLMKLMEETYGAEL